MSAKEEYKFFGHSEETPLRAENLQIPYDDYYFLNATDSDATVADNSPRGGGTLSDYWRNCRAIQADVGGVVKIDYRNKSGNLVTEVITLVSGVPMPIRNIEKLYEYIDANQTQGSAKSYDDDGTLVTNAIKLRR